MDTKSILVVSLIAVLLVGIISFDDTFAEPSVSKNKHQEIIVWSDEVTGINESEIKIKQGTVVCTDQGEPCGEGEMRAKFHLVSTGIQGNIITGNAQGVIQGSSWGWLVSETSSSTDTELKNNGPLSFDYHNEDRLLTMSGNLVDENGLDYSFDAIGNISESKNGKAKIDIAIQLVSENGIVADIFGFGVVAHHGKM